MTNNLLYCSSMIKLSTDISCIQLLPFGKVATSKGEFLVDEISINEILKNFNGQQNDVVIDYEHQTLKDVIAPAGGWLKRLENRNSGGLWGYVEWTSRALNHIKAREYRYISPTIYIRPSDNQAIRLHSVALTNSPAIDGMQPLAAKLSLNNASPMSNLQAEINRVLRVSNQ